MNIKIQMIPLLPPTAIVFPQSVYSDVKSKYTDAIQNNNKRRFAIYLKTENDGFREKEI